MTDRRDPYLETFDDGPGGWHGAVTPDRVETPEIEDGVLISRSPWWVDYNHAPPGGGYLHLLAYLHTHAKFVDETSIARLGRNRFVDSGYSRDMRNARLTARLRGDVDLQGAQLLILAQADVPGTRTNFVLTGQPFKITPEWSEQTVTLKPDPDQWLCLGSRHDRTDLYGIGDIGDALRDLNVDIIFVLFPLTIVPLNQITDSHWTRADEDYAVDRSRLPSGVFMLDTVRIDYPSPLQGEGAGEQEKAV